MPETTAGCIQQYHRHQRAFAGLDQGQHFKGFIQRAKTARAQHQCVGFLDEEQFAGKEEVERQQVLGAINGRVGVLFKRQVDVEPQAVFQACSLVGSRHDAAATAGDYHQLGLRQQRADFPCQGVQRAFDRCARRAKHRDLAAVLELFQHAEGVIQLADCLQRDFCIPTVAVILGHAQHGEDHVAIKGDIRAVGGDQLELCVDLLREVRPVFVKMTVQVVIRFVRHSTSPSSQNLGRRRDIRPRPRHCMYRCMPKALHGVRQAAKRALYVPCDLETFALQVAGGQPSFALKILQNGVGNAVEGRLG